MALCWHAQQRSLCIGEIWAYNSFLLSRWGLFKIELRNERRNSGLGRDSTVFVRKRLWSQTITSAFSCAPRCHEISFPQMQHQFQSLSFPKTQQVFQWLEISVLQTHWPNWCLPLKEILINSCYFPNRKWQTAWAMEDHNWYLMEEYNQSFKELNIF